MKPCGTCKYFWNGYKGNVCGVHYKTERRFNQYSGETESWSTGNRHAEWMRSNEGECGPDRKLYKQSLSSKIAPYFKWFLFICWMIFIIYIFYIEAGK